MVEDPDVTEEGAIVAAARPARIPLDEQAAKLPTSPGVYQFKSERGTVLYVGKAQNLRSRVRQYVSGGDGRHQIPALVDRASDVEILVTRNVKEALLLENELIKQHKPVFNVRLRDDKQYLALRIDESETWPRVTMVRKFRKDGAQYFGPYTSSVALKSSLSKLRRLFPLRSCTEGTFKDYARRGRPCIEYEMKLPHLRFNRRVGMFADGWFDVDGDPMTEEAFNASRQRWLPSDEDEIYVKSLMQPVLEPGKIAGWIAPPSKGINDQPFEYDYVKL